MYFKAFPVINYSLDGGNTTFAITDIFRRVKALQENLETSLIYDEYDILEGETPEIVADKLYNESYYHWTILITNNIIDPRFDWPMSSAMLRNYIKRKYSIENVDAVKHYINDDDEIVHSSYAGTKYPVSYFDYEEAINESKRRINIIKPQFLPAFVNSFKGSLNGR
jgi:hypothetical protein